MMTPEQIVEIVRDPSGQAPHRFHFLRLAKLFVAPPQEFFGLLALGNIAADDDDLFDLAAMVSHRAARGFQDAPLPILAPEPVFHAWTHARLKCFHPCGKKRARDRPDGFAPGTGLSRDPCWNIRVWYIRGCRTGVCHRDPRR